MIDLAIAPAIQRSADHFYTYEGERYPGVTGILGILDKSGPLTPEEMEEMRQHPRRGFEALATQGGFPPEMLGVVLHHHEFLDGTGYPDGLNGKEISDIVRLTTIVDIYAALVEKRAYRLQFTHV